MIVFLLGVVILVVAFFLTGGVPDTTSEGNKKQDENNNYADNNTNTDISGGYVEKDENGNTSSLLQGVYPTKELPKDLSAFWSLSIGDYTAIAYKGQYSDFFTFSEWAYSVIFTTLPQSFFDNTDVSVFGVFKTSPSPSVSSDMEKLVDGVVGGKKELINEYIRLAKRRLDVLLSGGSVWDNTTKNPVVLPRRWCKGMTLDKMYYVPLYGFKACLQFKLVRRETDNAIIWSYRGFSAQYSTSKAANDLKEKSVDWLGVPPKHPSFTIQVNETEK